MAAGMMSTADLMSHINVLKAEGDAADARAHHPTPDAAEVIRRASVAGGNMGAAPLGVDDEDLEGLEGLGSLSSGVVGAHAHRGTGPLSPRSTYVNKRRAAEHASVLLMKHLTEPRVRSIKEQFRQRGGEVDMFDFVRIMEAHLPEFRSLRPEFKDYGETTEIPEDLINTEGSVSEPALVTFLVEMFKEIDINGDAMLEWEELTTFIVEKAAVYRQQSHVDNIPEYQEKQIFVDNNRRFRHANLLDGLTYMPRYNQIAAIEQHSPIITLYNADDGSMVTQLRGHRGVPMAMEYIDSQSTLVTCCADMTLVTWNVGRDPVKRYRMKNRWPTPHAQMSLCWLDQHQLLFSGSTAGSVHAWNIGDREEKLQLNDHSDIVMELLSMPQLDNVVSGSLDTTICVWDTHTGARRQKLVGHNKGVYSLSYNPEHRLLFSAGFDHEALLWSPFVPGVLFRLQGHSGSLVGVQCVPNSYEVVTADTNGYIKVWDLRNFQCIQTFSDDSGMSGMTDFVHTGSQIVACTKTLHFFEQQTDRVELITDETPVSCALYNSNSLTILTTTDRTVKIWDAVLGKIKCVYRDISEHDITSVCLDDRQRKFILGDDKGNIKVYNYSNGHLMKSLTSHDGEVSSLTYVSQMKAVLSSGWDCAVKLLDEFQPEKGIVLRRLDQLQQHTQDVTRCVLTFTYNLIATSGSDLTLRLWDFQTGKLEELFALDYTVMSMTFLDPYPLLLVCDNRGCMRIWGTRQSVYRYRCLMALEHMPSEENNPPTLPLRPSTVLSLAWDPEDEVIYTGNELGVLNAWSLKETLKTLGRSVIDTSSLRTRSPSALAAVMMSAAKRPPLDPSEAAFPTHLWAIEGHSDGVHVCQLTDEPKGLLTASYDRCVSMWSTDGERKGTLLMGLRADEGNSTWDLRLNINARRMKEDAEIAEVCSKLWQPDRERNTPRDENGNYIEPESDSDGGEGDIGGEDSDLISGGSSLAEREAAEDDRRHVRVRVMRALRDVHDISKSADAEDSAASRVLPDGGGDGSNAGADGEDSAGGGEGLSIQIGGNSSIAGGGSLTDGSANGSSSLANGDSALMPPLTLSGGGSAFSSGSVYEAAAALRRLRAPPKRTPFTRPELTSLAPDLPSVDPSQRLVPDVHGTLALTENSMNSAARLAKALEVWDKSAPAGAASRGAAPKPRPIGGFVSASTLNADFFKIAKGLDPMG